MFRAWILPLLIVTGIVSGMPALAWAQKPKKQPPPAGAVFHLSPQFPKYATCDIEFRHPEEKKWPNFLYGKPAQAGTFTYDLQAPSVSLVLQFDHLVQKNGEQDRRVLGELIQPGQSLPMTLRLTKAEPFQKVKIERLEKGKLVTKEEERLPVEGELTVQGKKIPLRGLMQVKYIYGKNSDTPETVALELTATIEGKLLGLSDPLASGPLLVRAGCMAYLKPPSGAK